MMINTDGSKIIYYSRKLYSRNLKKAVVYRLGFPEKDIF